MIIEIDLQTDNLQGWINESKERIEGNIKYDVQRRVADMVVEKLLKEIIVADFYSKETLLSDIEKKILEKIDVQVNKLITTKLSEYKLEDRVKSLLNAQIRDMIDTKMSKVMGNLLLVDQSELQGEGE